MTRPTITPHDLATLAGGVILAAATNAVIVKTGGYFTSHALLVSGLALGVFAAAWSLGKGIVPKAVAAVVITFLLAGELYNFASTAERIVTTREEVQTPLRDLALKRKAAVDRLADLEAGKATSERRTRAEAALVAVKAEAGETQRVRLARKALADAEADVAVEAANIRCHTECQRKQGVARDKQAALDAALDAEAGDRRETKRAAEAEAKAALDEAVAKHASAIEAAKADVKANPEPASATPLADRTGVPSWALDLVLAALLSLAANGLAACLIAVGARGEQPDRTDAAAATDAFGQSDYGPAALSDANVVRLFRPDRRTGGGPAGPGPGPGPGPRPDRPKPVRPSGGLSKAEAFDDLLRRLADGRTVDSQDQLASDWNRPKQTVSDWLREWRRIGVVPAATAVGRCKSTVPV